MSGNDYYEISLEIKGKTDKALLLSDGYNTEWVPISQIRDVDLEDDYFEVGEFVDFEIKEWILIDKSFI